MHDGRAQRILFSDPLCFSMMLRPGAGRRKFIRCVGHGVRLMYSLKWYSFDRTVRSEYSAVPTCTEREKKTVTRIPTVLLSAYEWNETRRCRLDSGRLLSSLSAADWCAVVSNERHISSVYILMCIPSSGRKIPFREIFMQNASGFPFISHHRTIKSNVLPALRWIIANYFFEWNSQVNCRRDSSFFGTGQSPMICFRLGCAYPYIVCCSHSMSSTLVLLTCNVQ